MRLVSVESQLPCVLCQVPAISQPGAAGLCPRLPGPLARSRLRSWRHPEAGGQWDTEVSGFLYRAGGSRFYTPVVVLPTGLRSSRLQCVALLTRDAEWEPQCVQERAHSAPLLRGSPAFLCTTVWGLVVSLILCGFHADG